VNAPHPSQLKKVYASKKSKKVEKGIAFPACVSVNNICGPYSPLKDESSLLKNGDIAKVDLGCHIDGYIAQAAQTVVVGGGKATGNIIVKNRETIRRSPCCPQCYPSSHQTLQSRKHQRISH
jgi:methionine aminopeptidase